MREKTAWKVTRKETAEKVTYVSNSDGASCSSEKFVLIWMVDEDVRR